MSNALSVCAELCAVLPGARLQLAPVLGQQGTARLAWPALSLSSDSAEGSSLLADSRGIWRGDRSRQVPVLSAKNLSLSRPLHTCRVGRGQAGCLRTISKRSFIKETNTVLSSAPKGQPKMWVLEDYPSSEEKPIINLEVFSLESSFRKPPSPLF